MGRDARECRHAHHKRYYAKTAFKYKPREWTVDEDKLVLMHVIPDSELSPIIKRSMKAISNRRWRLKRAEGPIDEYQVADDRVIDVEKWKEQQCRRWKRRSVSSLPQQFEMEYKQRLCQHQGEL